MKNSILVFAFGLMLVAGRAQAQDLQTGHPDTATELEAVDQATFDVLSDNRIVQTQLQQFTLNPIVDPNRAVDATVVIDEGRRQVSVVFKTPNACATRMLCAGPATIAKLVRAQIANVEETRCGGRKITARVDSSEGMQVVTVRDNSKVTCNELVLLPKTAVKIESLDRSGDVLDLKTFVGSELH